MSTNATLISRAAHGEHRHTIQEAPARRRK
jgi:hypothetical protein